MTRAFDLERRGDYAGAAQAYRTVLNANPSDVSALLGLERSLLPLEPKRRDAPGGACCARGRSHQLGGVRHRATGLGCGRSAGQRQKLRRAVGAGRADR